MALIFTLPLTACFDTSAREDADTGTDELPAEGDADSDANSDPETDACDDTIWFSTVSDAERAYAVIRLSFEYNAEGWYQDYESWTDVDRAQKGFRNVPDGSSFRWSFEFDEDDVKGNDNEIWSCNGNAAWGTNRVLYDGVDQPILINLKDPSIEDGCELTTVVGCG